MSRAPWLIVGLGNPGERYAGTRHNVGAMVIQELASRHQPTPSLRINKRTQMALAQVHYMGAASSSEPVKLILATPTSFMNTSGGPVKAAMGFFSIPPDRLIVVHDELELDPGVVRLRCGGGDKGHNGLKSITQSLGTKNYFRLSCGIGRPPGRMDPAAFALASFPAAQEADVAILCADAADAAEKLVLTGSAPL